MRTLVVTWFTAKQRKASYWDQQGRCVRRTNCVLAVAAVTIEHVPRFFAALVANAAASAAATVGDGHGSHRIGHRLPTRQAGIPTAVARTFQSRAISPVEKMAAGRGGWPRPVCLDWRQSFRSCSVVRFVAGSADRVGRVALESLPEKPIELARGNTIGI